MLTFLRARGLAAMSCVGVCSVVACATSRGDAPEHVGANASAVWNLDGDNYGDQTDADDPASNIVVSLAKTATGPSVCTGTLLTPRLVLTAASCKNDGKAGALPYVRVGGRVPYRQTVASSAFHTFGAVASEPSLSGQDVGVVVLQDYVLEPARIHHPPLTAPAPLGSPAPGGLEVFASVGVAGWASTDPGGGSIPYAQNARQALVSDPMSLWRYWLRSPSHEPFWVFKPYTDDGVPKLGLALGDIGGPLFVKTADGHRNVIGVASILGDPPDLTLRAQDLPAIAQCTPFSRSPGSVTSCSAWVDITSPAVKSWLLGKIADTTRGATWLATHPRVGADQGSQLWIGDVDYYGACDTAQDPDCDHIWNLNADHSARDNCPSLANIDQVDSDDDGLGDACDPCAHSNSVCTSGGGSKQCGPATDSCGQSVNCGGCSGGLTCVSNTCKQCQTCADLHAACGTVVNNCGQTLDCGGACGAGSACVNNACQACTAQCPSTWSCGSVRDTCGHLHGCGNYHGFCGDDPTDTTFVCVKNHCVYQNSDPGW
jgi:hypothetical protein